MTTGLFTAHDTSVYAAVGILLSPEFREALDGAAREKVVTGGWRAGKSMEAAAEIWGDPPFWSPAAPALYWIVGPTYQAAHKEFDYLVQWAQALGLVQSVAAPEDGIRSLRLITNTVVETRSGQHPERIASDACQGIVVVEAGQQPESIRYACLGRVLETGGWITYTGTIEDDEGHPRWAWYAKAAEEWAAAPSSEHASYRLPSWANVSVFPAGRTDPKIVAVEAEFDSYTFARRIAAVATGVAHPVYPQLLYGRNRLVTRAETSWYDGAGGQDYGTTIGHESSLCAVTVDKVTLDQVANIDMMNVIWVRESWAELGGDVHVMNAKRGEMRVKYRATRWGVDPNERATASAWDATAVAAGAGTRGARQGRVRSLLNEGRLLFDLAGPGVPELYAEMKRVHYKVADDGQLVYVRIADNRTAALENAIEVLEKKHIDFDALRGLNKPPREVSVRT